MRHILICLLGIGVLSASTGTAAAHPLSAKSTYKPIVVHRITPVGQLPICYKAAAKEIVRVGGHIVVHFPSVTVYCTGAKGLIFSHSIGNLYRPARLRLGWKPVGHVRWRASYYSPYAMGIWTTWKVRLFQGPGGQRRIARVGMELLGGREVRYVHLPYRDG
jgi:hypothetical protein